MVQVRPEAAREQEEALAGCQGIGPAGELARLGVAPAVVPAEVLAED